jgi:hypothetical protein
MKGQDGLTYKVILVVLLFAMLAYMTWRAIAGST